MIISSAVIADGSFRRNMVINKLDPSVVDHVTEIFRIYNDRGTIIAGSIDSDVWILSNERKYTELSFRVNEFAYRRFAEDWIHCSYSLFVKYLKAFSLLKLGSLEIYPIHKTIDQIIRLVESKDPFTFVPTRAVCHYVAEFLRLLPEISESREQLSCRIDALSSADSKSGDQRLLSDFAAYLRFHDSMKAVWSDAAEDDRLFIFPLWLWWNLTMILPLRPTEFLLTPNDCVTSHEGRQMIRIRRTRLKGLGGEISYTVDGDFEINEYPVPDNIADQILWYNEALKKRGYESGKYLFSLAYHYDYLQTPDFRRVHDYYNYRHMQYDLSKFYDHFAPEDPRLRLGDTRHLAMISLIISGGSPVVCRELAGHDSIEVSSHYYSNIANLVECATYEFYRKSIKAHAEPPSRSSQYVLDLPSKQVRTDGGWCCSPEFLSHSVKDCILSISHNGEIGSCNDCKYFRPDRQGMIFRFEDTDFNKERVKADSWFLMYMTEAVRLGGTTNSDLYRALLRLQNSCSDYHNSIINALRRKEDPQHGSTT